nr:8299_t:CDS:2 [Entrophospora candida]
MSPEQFVITIITTKQSLPQEINKDHSITPLQKMFAAYSGTLLTLPFETQFDVIKTRSQSQNVSNNNTFSDIKPLASTSYSSTSLALPSCCHQSYGHTIDKLWASWKGKYSEVYSPLIAGATAKTTSASQGSEGINGLRGVLNGVQTMIFNNGISSLWRGLESRFNNVEVTFLSGDISGGFSALIATPFDVSKTRRQVSIIQCKPPGKEVDATRYVKIRPVLTFMGCNLLFQVVLRIPVKIYMQDFLERQESSEYKFQRKVHFNLSGAGELIALNVTIYPNIIHVRKPNVQHPGTSDANVL